MKDLLDRCNHPSCLIVGIGNVARQDDGLGWAFIDWLERESLCPQGELSRHYQLQLQDADLISAKSTVLFVDATRSTDVETFRLEQMAAKLDFSFTSHALSIPAVMATCQQCFQQSPQVYLLTIRGYAWELETGLTRKAQRNLSASTDFFGKAPDRQVTHAQAGPDRQGIGD